MAPVSIERNRVLPRGAVLSYHICGHPQYKVCLLVKYFYPIGCGKPGGGGGGGGGGLTEGLRTLASKKVNLGKSAFYPLYNGRLSKD